MRAVPSPRGLPEGEGQGEGLGVHAIQVITCGVGWILIWCLIRQSDLLAKLG
jgi:hypothetical protein